MRRSWALLFFTAIIGLAAACGSDGAAAPTQQAATSQAPTATAQPKLATTNLGTLEVRVTDQPGVGASAIVLTVRNIEVNVSKTSESGWQVVVEGPREFDLLKLDGIEEVLGSAMLEVGRYQQIRLEVVGAKVTIPNGVRAATVPSDKLRLVGGFDVVKGETTIVTLDFDAQKSLTFIPMRGPQLKPVVKLLVRKGGQALKDASAVANIGEDTVGADNTAAPRPTPTQATQAAAGGLKPVRVAIPNDSNLQWMNFWVALGAGFFQDEGVAVQVVMPPSPDATAQFMVQGGADVAVLPPPPLLESIGRGEPVVTFANLFQNDPINVVVRKQVAEKLGLSSSGPLAERLNAMRGLKVGVAIGPPTRLRVLFDSVGLDADSDIEMMIVGPPEQNQAFADGTIDAGYFHTPFLETALVEQGGVLIVNQSAGEVPELANLQYHTISTTPDYAGANPEVLVAIARAVHRAQQLIHTDLQATADAIHASGVKLEEPQGLETILAIYEPAIPQTPEVSVEGLLQQLERFPAHRTPPDLSGIDLAAHVDNRFALEAASKTR